MGVPRFITIVLSFAFLFALPASAQLFRGTPMPEGRGCEVTHCQRMWDHELQRPFRRCFWRCPRPRRAPPVPQEQEHYYRVPRDPPSPPPVPEYVPPPPPRYEPPAPRQYEAQAPHINLPEIPVEVVFGILGLVALAILGTAADHFNRIRLARETDEALNEAAAAAAAKAKLEEATREAEAVIKRQATNAFRRGRGG